MNATVHKKLFYNQESAYGVFALVPNTNTGEVKLNSFKNFVVNGVTPELQEGDNYNIEIEPSTHPKYGDGYTFIAVEARRPETIEEQQDYLRTQVTQKQYWEIIKVYPNHYVLDLFEKDEIDYSNMKGIKESTYGKIKQKLLENLEINEALVELKDLEISFIAMQKLIKHFGSSQVLVNKVRNNIYTLCEVDSFGFKKIDKYALNRGDDPNSKDRIATAVHHVLKEDSSRDGHSWMSRRGLIDDLVRLLSIGEDRIAEVVKMLEEKDKRIYFSEGKVALTVNHNHEKTIKDILVKKMNKKCNTSQVDKEARIHDQENNSGITYTEEQKNAIRKAIDNNVLIVNGLAGAGKSVSVKGIISSLRDFTYCTACLSGKAANVLRKQDLEAKTIHRMLGINPKNGRFIHNEENRLSEDIIIIDEASMANSYLIYSVLIALRDDAKIIFVGDSGQLPPIGTGAVFHDLIESDVLPKQTLTEIHRQAENSGILKTANVIREGHHITDKYSYDTQTVGELRDMAIVPTKKETDIKGMVVDICKRNTDKSIYNFQVITGRVDSGDLSVKSLNIEAQKVFNDTNKPFVSRGGYEYREGDKVIQNGNNYEADVYTLSQGLLVDEEGMEMTTDVFNGTMGKISKIAFDDDKTKQNHKVFIEFEGVDDGLVMYDSNDLNNISMAYAITVHRAQGESIKNVVFAFDFASFMLLSREFVYTGVTRASDGCIMIVENKALRFAIEKTVGDNRRTFLKEMLKESDK